MRNLRPKQQRERVRAIDVAGRVPPHNADAEAAVLSSVLTDGQALDVVLEILPNGESFYSDAHRRIYDAAVELHGKGQPVDIQTVAAILKDRDRLQAVGGIAYLVKLVDATPSVANVAAHARIVREKARVRRLIETCEMVAAQGYGDYGTASEFIAKAANDVAQIAEVDTGSRIQSAAEVARSRDAEIEEQWAGKREPWGMRGPHRLVHEMTHGYGLGEQTFLAADTGGGKSVYALQVARHIAGRTYNGDVCGVGYLSLEMLSKRHYDRALIQATHEIAREQPPGVGASGVSMRELMTGMDADGAPLDEGKRWILAEARRRWRALPLELDDAPKDAAQIKITARAMQRRLRERGAALRLLVIDHLHIVELDGDEGEAKALADLVRSFNDLAKELEIHLLVLAQFNRATTARGGRPVVSDIKGASAIEQIAHKVVLLYRPWLRLPDKSTAEAASRARDAEFIVAKHRDGRQGVIPMEFDGNAFTFHEVTDQEHDR